MNIAEQIREQQARARDEDAAEVDRVVAALTAFVINRCRITAKDDPYAEGVSIGFREGTNAECGAWTTGRTHVVAFKLKAALREHGIHFRRTCTNAGVARWDGVDESEGVEDDE